MAREVRKDLQALGSFVENYSLGTQANDRRFLALLSRQHKRYLATLTLLSELEHQQWTPFEAHDPRATHVNAVFHERLTEYSSDLGNAIFVWIHGAYKASRLVLRSGIENFVKAIGVQVSDDIINLRNTYAVFDMAEKLPLFGQPGNRARFLSLQGTYSTLSLDVHTATRARMEHVGALSHFPTFDGVAAREFVQLLDRTATNVLDIACLMFPNAYRSMHYANRDIVNLSLSLDARAILNRTDRT